MLNEPTLPFYSYWENKRRPLLHSLISFRSHIGCGIRLTLSFVRVCVLDDADYKFAATLCPDPYDVLNAFGTLSQIGGDV